MGGAFLSATGLPSVRQQQYHQCPAMTAREYSRGMSNMTETEADALLAANLDFYRAFATRDMAAMERVWARETPVLCLHPGWALLRGRDAVLESWRQIL